ncbi:hypothetical protein GGH94_001817 [Coemansia aciculifera]|uniref:G-protein coupled receptors family 3 profile domain-containing protein n=1 Tax=Coemansia aciculifera TaxID=417176 RepID=A0A9W8IM84_9FUNG|nr:hypothetical protein GGH94_001817 [Coemansia aciculifera]KAJ2873655.1 hypothetical protein GGH93_003046 [Coemansia aciculifera]
MGNTMSFSVTAEEKARVEIFKAQQMVLEPRQAADLIMVIVITVVYFFQLLAVLFMLWNRKYPPIKAKNPWMMLPIFLAYIFWFVGDLHVNGHAPLKGTALENCKAFGVWLHLLFGIYPVSVLIGLRSYSLYQVFCRNRPFLGFQLYASVAFVVGWLLTFGIVSSALPGSKTVYYLDGFDMCSYSSGFQAAIFVYVWIAWFVVAALNWRIRNIKSSFNESREITIACTVVFSVLTFVTVLSYVEPTYPVSLKWRILTTSLNHFSTIATWWLPMAVPMYKCLTDREAYQKEWVLKLRQDGLQRAYHVNTESTDGVTAPGESYSYLHQCQADQRRVMALNKELGSANANGEFFYSPNNEAGTEKVNTHIRTDVLGSSVSSGNDDGEVGIHSNSSDSNLVQRSQLSPAPKRPWDKLTNAVSNIGGPSLVSGSNSSASVSPSAATQLYTPIINFSEPATNTPHRSNVAQSSHSNGKYTPDGRQLI